MGKKKKREKKREGKRKRKERINVDLVMFTTDFQIALKDS